MTDYGLTPAGFVAMPAPVIEAEVITSLRGIAGLESLTAGDEEAFAKWAAIHAEREALIWELSKLVWQSGSRELSTGASLDNNLSLIGNSRLEESHSTVAITLYNRTSSTPVSIPADSQARQSTTGVIWELLTDAEIPGNADLHTGLAITDILWQSGNTIRATFGATDFSTVAVGDEITISSATNSANNGTFPITAVSDASNYLEYLNTARASNALDEVGSPATADVNDSITVLAQSLSAGTYEAAVGSINEIVTPISGWDGVINLAAALTGRVQETDSAAKARAAVETQSASGGTLEAVKQAVEAIDGVIYVSAEENETNETVGDLKPNSIHITVVGGLDQDIVNAIGENRAAGIDTNGSQTGTYTNTTGDSKDIYFDRVTEINPYITVEVTVTGSYPSTGDDTIKAALTAMAWTHGQDLINLLLFSAVGSSGIAPYITSLTVKQGLTASPTLTTNIAIASTEVVNITADRIVVTHV